jgi:4'-phosphopantetheinyl transferase
MLMSCILSEFNYEKKTYESIDIFLLNVDDNINCITHDIIPSEQIRDIDKYRLPNDRNKRLLARSFLYTYLSDRYAINNFELNYNNYQKPHFKNHENISFSISYAGEYVVIAVSKDYDIGVDIEYVDESIDCDEIKSLIMCSYEENHYNRLIEQYQKYSFFFELFNTKEAIIKCFGMGLFYDVQDINILNLSKFTDLGYILHKDIFAGVLGFDYKTSIFFKLKSD